MCYAPKRVVFVDGARTTFGLMGGTLKDISASKLAGIGIKGLVERAKIREKGVVVDCVFLGSATHCSKATNLAHWAARNAGLGHETTAFSIEMQERGQV